MILVPLALGLVHVRLDTLGVAANSPLRRLATDTEVSGPPPLMSLLAANVTQGLHLPIVARASRIIMESTAHAVEKTLAEELVFLWEPELKGVANSTAPVCAMLHTPALTVSNVPLEDMTILDVYLATLPHARTMERARLTEVARAQRAGKGYFALIVRPGIMVLRVRLVSVEAMEDVLGGWQEMALAFVTVPSRALGVRTL